MDGIINLDKPPGWTSRQAVDAVLRHVRPAKAGHAGTLDPIATGVLLIAIGKATRLIEHLQRMPKTYRAEFLLGRTSASDDVEGEVRVEEPIPNISATDVRQVIPRFLGAIEQVPPAYSAVKLGGRRAYRLARQGKQVKIAPRTVRVDAIEIVECQSPTLVLEIRCGGGTYVRSLGRDIARSLDTTAVMARLERTAIGTFRTADAVCPTRLDASTIAEYLRPLIAAVPDLPRQTLDDEQLERIANGRLIDLPSTLRHHAQIAAVDAEGRLHALLVPRGTRWGPSRNLG